MLVYILHCSCSPTHHWCEQLFAPGATSSVLCLSVGVVSVRWSAVFARAYLQPTLVLPAACFAGLVLCQYAWYAGLLCLHAPTPPTSHPGATTRVLLRQCASFVHIPKGFGLDFPPTLLAPFRHPCVPFSVRLLRWHSSGSVRA
jgi:hypothetical protein